MKGSGTLTFQWELPSSLQILAPEEGKPPDRAPSPGFLKLRRRRCAGFSSTEWGKGERSDQVSTGLTTNVLKGNKEKPLTLPRVWEANRAGLRLSPIAKRPKVKELSHHGQVCKPAPLGTWHDSVVGEKESQKVLALSSRNQGLACGCAGRCRGAWSRRGEGAAAKLP